MQYVALFRLHLRIKMLNVIETLYLILKPSRKRKRSVTTPRQIKGKVQKTTSPITPASSKTPFSPLPSSLNSKINNSASKAAASLARFKMNSSPVPPAHSVEQNGNFLHERLDWLKEEHRKWVKVMCFLLWSEFYTLLYNLLSN